MKSVINIALPKGRLGEKVYGMFEKAGFDCPSIKENNRKLTFENEEKGIRFFWVKPSDVAIYVERGAADIGIAGKDILLEYQPDVYELLDLGIGKCRMAVAAKKSFRDNPAKTLRVATKFTNIAREFYAGKCRDICYPVHRWLCKGSHRLPQLRFRGRRYARQPQIHPVSVQVHRHQCGKSHGSCGLRMHSCGTVL